MSEVQDSRKEKDMKQTIRKAVLLSFMAPACHLTLGTSAAQSSSTSSAGSTQMAITPSSSQKVITGGPDRFTGSVRVQSLFDAKEPARSTGGQVTFQPGARSRWHTHPLGQTLIVTDGVGWIQQWGGPVQVIRKGDVVWISAGVKHWHGATPTTTLTHIALQEQLDGRTVDWLEPVSDAQYRLTK
jgi:quercetin dioxygenase-like cupin family protein